MLPAFDFWTGGAVALDVAAASRAPRAEVLQRQQRRLAALLRSAAERSPLYRQRLGTGDPGALKLADIEPVTKPELMRRFADWVTDPRLQIDQLRRFAADPARIGEPCLDGCLLWTSSGSSGEPALFVQDARAMAVYDALEALRRPPPPRNAARWPSGWWPAAERWAFVGATGGHFASTVSVERLRRLVPGMARSLSGFSFLQPASELAAQLEAFAPSVLATYPTMALLLAEERAAGRLAIAPREVLTGGETLTPGMRRRIGAAFGCRVCNSYGASEFLAIASECSAGSLHVNDDWLVLESVDQHGAPVPDGTTGHGTLLTNLANHLQPIIRYQLGDRIRVLAEPCACGSPLSRIEVDGRSDELLALHDAHGRIVRLAPLAIATVIEEQAGVFDFRLQQTAPASLYLSIAAGGAAGRAELARAQAALTGWLAGLGLDHVRLETACGVAGPRAANGKRPRVVALADAHAPRRPARRAEPPPQRDVA